MEPERTLLSGSLRAAPGTAAAPEHAEAAQPLVLPTHPPHPPHPPARAPAPALAARVSTDCKPDPQTVPPSPSSPISRMDIPSWQRLPAASRPGRSRRAASPSLGTHR